MTYVSLLPWAPAVEKAVAPPPPPGKSCKFLLLFSPYGGPFCLYGGPFLSLWGAFLGLPPPTKISPGSHVYYRSLPCQKSAGIVENRVLCIFTKTLFSPTSSYILSDNISIVIPRRKFCTKPRSKIF